MESFDVVIGYMQDYGMFFLFIIVYLEYLNLPGLPAGIIMPAIGLLISRSDTSFIYALSISVLAGMLGSYTLYAIGYFIGSPIVDQVYEKYEKVRPSIDKSFGYINKYGNRGILVSRLIPIARTLISLVGGTVQMKLRSFTFYSVIGITLWNTGFILAGYLIGCLGD